MRRILSFFRRRDGEVAKALYAALVVEAREPAWYREGGVADDLDGRFALLATHVALAILRLERGGDEAVRGSVALTEAFIADMDAQMREIGFDTKIGKQVRGMVGALASRVDRWRGLTPDGEAWREAAEWSVFRNNAPSGEAIDFAAARLAAFHRRIEDLDDAEMLAGGWR